MNKFIGKVAMRTSVPAQWHSRRERRSFHFGQFNIQSLKLIVIAPFLSADSSPFAMVARSIPAHRHACRTAFAGSEKCDFGAKRILVRVVFGFQMCQGAGHFYTGNLSEAAAGDAVVKSI